LGPDINPSGGLQTPGTGQKRLRRASLHPAHDSAGPSEQAADPMHAGLAPAPKAR